MLDRRWIANPCRERAALAAVLLCGGVLWSQAFAGLEVEHKPVSAWEALSRELQNLPAGSGHPAHAVVADSGIGEGR